MARAPKKVKDDSPVHVYPVLGSVRHDGEWFEAGDEIELSEFQAAPLLDGGSIGPAKAPPAPKSAAPPAK